jgi:predicted DNA-binding protein
MVKVTFSIDDETWRTLRETAERLGKSQSLVVREAVADYAARAGDLTEAERRRMLKIVDELLREPRRGVRGAAAAEIREIRRSRRSGGRRHAGEPA